MGVYIIILLMTTITAMITVNCGKYKRIELGGKIVDRKIPSIFGTFLVCVILIFFFAARWNVGTDYVNYYSRFFKLLNVDYLSIFKDYRDCGFYLFTAFVGKEISTNYFVYSLLLGCIIYIPIIFIYRKYCNHFVLTCALYIMLCLYTWPYNGMRQSVAISILFFGYQFLYDKNDYWKYGLTLILAFLFHSSTILVAPFILITRMKPWSKMFISVCLTIVILIIMLPSLWTTVINFLESIGQTKMANDYSDLENLRSGVNFFRIAVAALPVLLSLFYYDKLKKNNPHVDLVINMCVINLIFLLCGYRVTVIARFASFFNIGLPLLISEFIDIFNSKYNNYKNLVGIIIFVLFFVHMIILLPNDSGLVPYEFIFEYM